jgi:2-polyprenyl-3-methyl-5-hydroxy-6-metoxy-1,4-benzoquinol methylase
MPTCLACGSVDAQWWAHASDEEYCTTQEVFSYYRCADCGSLFIDPVPREQLKIIYPSNYYSFDGEITGSILFKVKDWLDRRFFRRFVAVLSAPVLRVLDVGGGSGAQLSAFKRSDERIRHTAIVDLDDHARAAANKRGHEYFCSRFEEFDTQHRFDVILMLNLIEHVDNPKQMLTKACSLLAPNGLLIVKTPNTDSLDARIFRRHNWGGYHCPRHWVLFNRENLTRFVAEAGLKIRHFQYTQGAPFWTTTVLFFLARRGWIKVSKERPAPTHPLYAPLNAVFAMFDLVRGLFAKTSQMIVVLERG